MVSIGIGGGTDTLAVTQNLATALPYLCYEDKPRCLWVDAVYVDQQNLQERSAQVLRMGDIYRLAKRVLVWPGVEDASSGQTISVLDNLASKVEFGWNTRELLACSEEGISWADANSILELDEETLMAINTLLSRPWFERVWIQQEVILANPSARVLCGADFILWSRFCGAIMCVTLKPKLYTVDEFLDLLRLSIGLMGPVTDTLGLIRGGTRRKCTDPRDRVYAVMGINVGSGYPIYVKPDYTQAVAKVYLDFTMKALHQMNTLEVLRECELRDTIEGIHLGYLKLTGKTCGTITGTEKVFTQHSDTSIVPQTIWELVPEIALDNEYPYIGGGTLFEAYFRTFFCDMVAERFMSHSDLYRPREKIMKDFSAIFSLDQSNEGEDYIFESYFTTSVCSMCEGRALFKTAEGYIGLAPQAAAVGDTVRLPLGSDVPIVLRSTEKGCYKMVGESYVCGMMDCEPLLGSLGDFDMVFQNFDEVVYVPAYRNRKAGHVLLSDPRLGPLPPGWRGEWDGPMQRFIKDIDPCVQGDESQQEWMFNDPRLTPEALLATGVNIVEYEIV